VGLDRPELEPDDGRFDGQRRQHGR
jgi:hypothetical protein